MSDYCLCYFDGDQHCHYSYFYYTKLIASVPSGNINIYSSVIRTSFPLLRSKLRITGYHCQRVEPSFIIAKTDKTIRFISDFREINKRIKWYLFPMPDLKHLLLKTEDFQ